MLLNSLIKKPLLPIGILLMVLLLFHLNKKGLLFGSKDRYNPTSCRSVLVMLNKRIPGHWSTKCSKNNLEVVINSELTVKNPENLKRVLYRTLANSLKFIASNSLEESLERTYYVTVKLQHSKLKIIALTEGKDISKLKHMNNPEMIADHLKATVKVQESTKK